MTWEWLGTEAIAMPPKFYVGLAVSSHDASKLCKTAFDQLSIAHPNGRSESAPKVGNGDGLQGIYNNGIDFTAAGLRRIDPVINFSWGYGTPTKGIGRNNFRVRWEGELQAQFSEPYAIQMVSDDRARLWINGELIIDEWYEHAEQASTAILNFVAGQRYLIRIDYFENRGPAVAKLFWSSPSTPLQIIPQNQLYSRISDEDGDGLPDVWELAHGLDPHNGNDAEQDVAENGRTGRKSLEEGFEPPPRLIPNPNLPAEWLSVDIGQVGLAGSVSFANDLWSIAGSGADIWANADGFQFVHRIWRGDGEIVARVVSQVNTDPWAKAGLMMRETLRGDSRHVTLAKTPANGLVFLQRNQTGATTSQQTTDPTEGARWLKLVRRGNRFISFGSSDGLNWQWINTQSLDLPTEVYVGIVVNSHDNSALGTALFDHVQVRQLSTEPAARLTQGKGDGLAATYFDSNTGLSTSRIDATVNFDWDIDAPADGIGADHFTVRWEGVVEAQTDELYAIHVISDDGARLWIDGQLLIDGWSDHAAQQLTTQLPMQRGQKHAIKLEFYERTREAIAKLLWSTPTIPQQPIPQSQLYSRPSTETDALASADAQSGNATSGEAQSNSKNIPSIQPVTGQKAVVRAASGPVITGYDIIATVPGAAAIARLGRWEIDGNSIYAVDRRGYVEYELLVPAADMYRLEIEGISRNKLDPDSGFYVLVSIDGEGLGRHLLDAAPGKIGKVQLYSPFLQTGTHRIRIFWDNARKTRSLQVNALRLQQMKGADSDKNGIIDWVQQKLGKENGIDDGGSSPPKTLFSSVTSPAFLEGRGEFLSMMAIQAGGQAVPARHGAGNRWFANVPLAKGVATAVNVSFQNGGLKQSRRIVWQTTDLLKDQDVTVRQGDALLFTVGPDAKEEMSIEVNGSTKYLSSLPVSHRFDESGVFDVTGTVRHGNGLVETGAIHVRVVGGSFKNSPAAWVGRARVWDCPEIPKPAVVEFDKRLTLGEDNSFSGKGRRYRVTIDQAEDRFVVARLSPGGPVFASAAIRGIQIYGVSES